jgi:homoserine O-acetyltransferase
MQIAFNEVGRQAIMGDANWNGGDYYQGDPPDAGLSVARMIGHITYLSDESMHERFGRRLRNKEALGYDFTLDFEVESYLRYQGEMFTRRFDANTYLYITKALDYFDLSDEKGVLVETFRDLPSEMRFLVVAFSSDWLYPPYQSKEIVKALKGNGLDCSYLEMRSSFGHDAFLLENQDLNRVLWHFMDSTARLAGVRLA